MNVESNKKITVVGCGKLGINLGVWLFKKGFEVSFESRSLESSKRAASIAFAKRDDYKKRIKYKDEKKQKKQIKQKNEKNFTDKIGFFSEKADIVFITVTDDKIEKISKKIKFKQSGVVFHCSGVLSSKVLNSVNGKTGSFHPVQSFSKFFEKNPFENIVIGIESSDKEVKKIGAEIAKKLLGTPFFIKTEDKILYHTSCCVAANYFTTLIDFAFSLLKETNINEKTAHKILFPLLYASLENAKNLGAKKALTGPILRNDVETIKKHIEAIKEKNPDYLKLYNALGLKTLQLADIKDKKKMKGILLKEGL